MSGEVFQSIDCRRRVPLIIDAVLLGAVEAGNHPLIYVVGGNHAIRVNSTCSDWRW